jgi:cobalt-zinc-cadmium efflux system membrane fusion protein
MRTNEERRVWIICATLLAITACGSGPGAAGDEQGEAEHGEGEAEFAKGPQGGRLLEEGDFAIELAIFETGVPPEFRAWVSEAGKLVPPEEVSLEVELGRFGGRAQKIGFVPAGDFLRGDAEVYEPHSFAVKVRAERNGKTHEFAYESYEGRVQVAAGEANASGIAVAAAGSASIRSEIELFGRVEPDGDRTAHVTPRFPGVATEVRKRLGDAVAKDEVVAVIESNESLRPYEVRSRIAGTAIQKSIVPGEFVASDAAVFVVSDLERVWVDLQVHRSDFARLRIGQRVFIDAKDGRDPIEARIDYLSPLGSFDSQTLLARVVAPNAERRLQPGLFVSARVELESVEVPVAVRTSALQQMRDRTVVFLADGESYEAQPVEIGRSDGTWTEVIGGLAAGQRYATTGSFVLKADVGKSGASHDH